MSPRPSPRHLLPYPLTEFDTPLRHKPHEPLVLLVPPRLFESTHCTAVIVGREVRLRAVFVHDVEQTEGEDQAGQTCAGGPVSVDAMGGVVFVGLEVEEAARVNGPGGGHAGTILVENQVKVWFGPEWRVDTW